jgi:hypothetical protein
VYEKAGDRHAVLQGELAFALESGSAEIKRNSNSLFRSEIIEFQDFIFSRPDDSTANNLFKICNQFQTKIDAILDSLSQKPNLRLAKLAQEHLLNYRSTMLELAGMETRIKVYVPQLPDSNWLVKAYEHDTPAGFAVTLAEAKVNVAILEQLILSEIRWQIGYLERYGTFMTFVSYQPINPQPGDSVTADIFLTEYVEPSGMLTYSLNGAPLLPGEDKTAIFEVRYDQPGLYPLRFVVSQRNWQTDSTEYFEKTYLLRVR